MRTYLNHIQFNIQPTDMPFYKDLMACLGWNILFDSPQMLGVEGNHGESFWFSGQVKEVSNDYDGPGVNHIGIGALTQADVDTVTAYLQSKNVECLFETPRHRPDFVGSPDQTYYQVMFETPGRILWEVVYTGPKT